MKILSKFTFLSLFATLILCSCGDDEAMVVVDDDLNGTWTAKSWSANIESATTGGGLNQSVTSTFTGTSFGYDLTFDNGSFTTDGNYSYTFAITGSGINQNGSEDVDNVNGNGTYTNTDTQLTLKGRIFEYEANGLVSVAASNEDTVLDYEINSDGDLVFTYDVVMTDTQAGFTTTSTISDVSVWERK